MPWFIFYPVCDISQPTFSCSNAWVMYFLFGVISLLSFQNILLTVIHYGCFLLATLYFDIGLPWYEIIWHLFLGYTVSGVLLIAGNKTSTALKIKLNFFKDLSKLFRLSLGFMTLFFAFYGVDDVIMETGDPYGLALAMVFSVAWVLAAGASFFCAEKVKDTDFEEQALYWIYWTQLLIATVITFLVAFIPSLSAYYKSLIACPVLLGILLLHRTYHKPLEFRRKTK